MKGEKSSLCCLNWRFEITFRRGFFLILQSWERLVCATYRARHELNQYFCFSCCYQWQSINTSLPPPSSLLPFCSLENGRVKREIGYFLFHLSATVWTKKNLSLSTGAFSGRFVLMRLEWMGTLMGCHHFTVEFCALKDLLSDRYQVNWTSITGTDVVKKEWGWLKWLWPTGRGSRESITAAKDRPVRPVPPIRRTRRRGVLRPRSSVTRSSPNRYRPVHRKWHPFRRLLRLVFNLLICSSCGNSWQMASIPHTQRHQHLLLFRIT